MTLIDVEALLAPIADETVCGIALEYDPDYLALERSIEGSPERQYGDTVIPAKAPDWSGIARQATELLAKSKDFNLAVILTRALTHTRGIEGTLAGMQLVLELGRRHWDEAFPSLHFDGEADLLPRSNAIAGLAAQEGLLGDLRAASFKTRQMGVLDFGSIERVASGRDPASAPFSRDQLGPLFAEEIASANPILAQLQQLQSDAQALHALCRDHMGNEAAPDLQPLVELIKLVCPPQLGSRSGSGESTEAAGHEDDTDAAIAPAGSVPRKAMTRHDATAMLDAVCSYLEESDPSNPAPLLIRRARGLIGRDFLSILREFAPDGVAQAELLAGVNRGD